MKSEDRMLSIVAVCIGFGLASLVIGSSALFGAAIAISAIALSREAEK